MHPLDGAYERINGAREHLNVLKPELRAFSQSVADGISLKYERRPILINGRWRNVPYGKASAKIAPAPPRVSRLIGEVVQNIRIALDYLVYELACFDAKGIVDHTQFPVADTEEKFEELLARYHLKVLTPDHIALIKRLQPFDGCDWPKRLAMLSNPDKHRHVTVVKSPVVVSIDERITEAILGGDHVDVQDYATVQITFSDGTPIIENLEQLLVVAVKTLDSFKPEFNR